MVKSMSSSPCSTLFFWNGSISKLQVDWSGAVTVWLSRSTVTSPPGPSCSISRSRRQVSSARRIGRKPFFSELL